MQPEPEDHAGAGAAEGGAREAEGRRPGEEPPAAGAHVTPLCVGLLRPVSHEANGTDQRSSGFVQGAAGPAGAGQAGPEGTGGHRGQLYARPFKFKYKNKIKVTFGLILNTVNANKISFFNLELTGFQTR